MNSVEILNGPVGSNPNVSDLMVDNVLNTKYKLRVNEKASRHRDCLGILHLNTQGVSSSFDKLKLLCADCSYADIIDLCKILSQKYVT